LTSGIVTPLTYPASAVKGRLAGLPTSGAIMGSKRSKKHKKTAFFAKLVSFGDEKQLRFSLLLQHRPFIFTDILASLA